MSLGTPTKVDFGVDGNKNLDNYVYHNLMALLNSYSTLHTSEVQRWRKLTKGIPNDKVKNFPWTNASNVVIQLIGENVDIIKAIQLGSIYEVSPLWVTGLVGDWKDEDKGEECRETMETFLTQMGLSKNELDLYRVESKAAHDINSLGSALIKLPWITNKEMVVLNGDEKGNLTEEEITIYDGPRPEKLRYEDWGATPTAQTWEEAQFKYHEYRLSKHECERKVYQGVFDKQVWEEIKNSPDVQGLTMEEMSQLEEQKLQSPDPVKELDRWRFYECWFKYYHNNKCYHIIYTIHLNPTKRLCSFFNFYPKNEEPFEFGRLGYNEDGLIGYGLAEMGELYQEEVTTGHNQRVDNRTLANMSIILGGNNPRMDAGIQLFHGCVLPFSKNDCDVLELGRNYPSSVQEEELTISLAKARFGTDIPGAEGQGSGTVDRKGNYSSMGTFSIMQQGSRRININVTDFRYMHLNLGQKFQRQYAWFGAGEDRLKVYGERARYLSKAFEAVKSGRMELPIKAATQSINKEIEKQTGMLFVNVMQRHLGAIGQMLQAVVNPTVPDIIHKYALGSIIAQSFVMGKLLRSFGYDDIYRMQPEKDIVEELQQLLKNQEYFKKRQEQQQMFLKQLAQQQGAMYGQQGVPQNTGAIQAGNRGPIN